jgi:hypothetical protein
MESTSLKKKYLLLFEIPIHFDAYLEKIESLESHELLICCLSTAAINYCKKNGLEYFLPEDYFSKEDNYKFRDQSEVKIKELVKSLNVYYHKQYKSKDGFLFDMGNYHFFMLYHFFGAMHYRAFILFNVLEKCKYDGILIPEEKKVAKNLRPFPVSQYPNCYLNLCMNSNYREKVITISITTIVERKYQTPKTYIRGIISSSLRRFRLINDFLNFTKSNVKISFWKFVIGRYSTDILLLGMAGPWKYILPDTTFYNKVSVIYEEETEIIYCKEDIRNWFNEWFDWEDVFLGFNIGKLSFYEMARIKLLSESIIANHNSKVKRLKQHKCIIYSVAPYPSQEYILSLAKFMGIPRVCFQHGEMSLYYPGLWNDASELLYVSHYFGYGEQVSIEKNESSSKIEGFVRAISVGSPSLDRIKQETVIENPIIVYASSKFLDYSMGFVERYCDQNVLDNQELIINYFEDYLKSHPETKVIWKQNQERLTGQPQQIVKNVKVIREEVTFIKLLKDAKLVILDRPSTTSLETCVTTIPLFVLLSNKNWYPYPETLLRKRAVVCHTPGELLEAIDLYLRHGVYPADLNNREFVSAYGTYFDDGLSAKRAAKELMNIINIV